MAEKGYVYVVHPLGCNAYKIGSTVNPEQRLKQLNVARDYKMEYAVLVKSDNHQWLEIKLHAHFKRAKLGGEWFFLSLEDIEYIKGL